MRNKIILLLLFCTLMYGCKEGNIEKSVNFDITNVTSGIVKELNIKIIDSEKTIDVLTLNNIDISKRKLK